MFATEAFGNPDEPLTAQAFASLAQLWWYFGTSLHVPSKVVGLFV